MSKSVLISIQPYYVFLIIAKAMGWDIPQEKTVEVRKTIPRDKDWNRKAIVYCSKNKKSFAKIPREYQPLMESFLGKVIAEFVCDEIVSFGFTPYNHGEYMVSGDKEKKRDVLKESCLSFNDMYEYIGEEFGYAWHISAIKIYDKPKELSEFHQPCKNLEEYEGEVYCDCFNCDYGEDSDYGVIACRRTITRPPQSWCYVEEIVSTACCESFDECAGCCHNTNCEYFDDLLRFGDKKAFEENCVGCCCGDGTLCNKNNGGCSNYEIKPIMG